MILSYAPGFAVDFECAPDEAFQLYPERGVLTHANHFVSPVALSKLKDTGIVNTPESLYRDRRVRGLQQRIAEEADAAEVLVRELVDLLLAEGSEIGLCRGDAGHQARERREYGA